MNFADRLLEAVRARSNPTVVGLDPHLALIPAEFAAAHDPGATRAEVAAAVGDFLEQVIDATSDLVPAVKPQSAFFEELGADGALLWERIVRRAHDAGMLVIGDVKRGDIGSTASAYARALLSGGPGAEPASLCDAITVNPYLGRDSVEPFVRACAEVDAGLYVLVRTSNPGGADLQNLGQPTLAMQVAGLVGEWGADLVGESGWSSVGAVVGATHASELAAFRAAMPHTPFLLPGYGAQGAGAADVVGAFGEGLAGGLVNSSRGILFAGRNEPEQPWKDATRAAALAMKRDLGRALSLNGSAT